MGTKVAPSYANLFMTNLEEKIKNSFPLKPTVWWRYINDIFFIWEHGECQYKNWVQHLNEANTNIKFTEEHSHTEIPFLDTKVKIDRNRKAYTDLYSKPTDSHSYLRYDSAYPPRCMQSLPYSQFLRIRRICTKKSDFEKHASNMKQDFLHRGYPKRLLEDKLNLVRSKNHKDLRTNSKENNKTDKEKPKEIFMATTFRPCKNSLTATIKQNWDLLGRSKTTKDIHRSKVTTSYKRPKKLKEILTRARTDYHENKGRTSPDQNNTNNNICRTKNCKYCTMLDTSGKMINHVTHTEHSTKHNVTCNSSNLIYCIKCKTCDIQYVGQTKRKIKDRMREHMYHTNKGIYHSDVPYHFNSDNHCGTDDMKVYILDFIYEHPDSKRAGSLRNTIEFNWIQTLRTQAPYGLNTMDNRYG